MIVINNGICAYFTGGKKHHQEKHFFSLYEISKLTLVSTKTTLVPLGINTPLRIENTKNNIIPRLPREKTGHFTEEEQGYFILVVRIEKTMKKYTILWNQIKWLGPRKTLRKGDVCFLSLISNGNPEASWWRLAHIGCILDQEVSPIRGKSCSWALRCGVPSPWDTRELVWELRGGV